ncbi:hypothetical protein TPHA_0C00520 [Tetrapisispora phaffii CBS 4417]|uniref:Uncharacterized protein n=1 Tax=Tetrapisispora phaffii (strain ATCC 24235 / CBS 4417 / NBRC 1672 / NRRL Y-8282 / UCD 70-5) TaxID=1071381 RepID=G8BR33_TETPH|nr:hypothetical protein TPHA_0C00520 [Tetrapisispora phaffii CBS 4417]CCE62209.1 hypothetical protein TPHA_0C00520 [Tetrapisispora phaffii CBS 4417]
MDLSFSHDLISSTLKSLEDVNKEVYIKTQDVDNVQEYIKFIRELLIDPFSGICSIRLISPGLLNATANGTTVLKDFYTRHPAFLVQCRDIKFEGHSSGTHNVYELERISTLINENLNWNVFVDLDKFDVFTNSNIFTIFIMALICMSTWMLLFLLVLLPSKSHFTKRKLIHFYVLLSGAHETGLLIYSLKHIFHKQHKNNYQDSLEFYKLLVNTDAFKVFELLTNFAFLFNCIEIVYYIYRDSKPIPDKYHYIPEYFRKNRNYTIVFLGLLVLILDQIFFALILWFNFNSVVHIFYLITEAALYFSFGFILCRYVYKNFGYMFHPKHIIDNAPLRLQDKLYLIWRDYYQTILILVHNILFYILLFFILCYLISSHLNNYLWKYGLLRLFKLIISVNAWGLINTMERQEDMINAETMLGKRIDNEDKLFNNPSLQYPIAKRSDVDFTDDLNSTNSYFELDSTGNTTAPLRSGNNFKIAKTEMNDNSVVQSNLNNPIKMIMKHPGLPIFSNINNKKTNERKFDRTSKDSRIRASNRHRIISMLLNTKNEEISDINGVSENLEMEATSTKNRRKTVFSNKVKNLFKAHKDESYTMLPADGNIQNDNGAANSTLHLKNENSKADVNEASSIETELTRNFIFDHDE